MAKKLNNKKNKKEILREKGYLPIREVSRLAGVEKSLIHFYVRQGLLPKPIKVSKQMAYYPPETVERIKLIKNLQKRYLPIKEIKKILKDGKDIEEIRRMLIQIDSKILQEYERDGRKEKGTKIDPKIIKELEKMGILDKMFREEIIGLIERLREIGLNEKNGFSIKFLKNYVDVCKKLVEIEFQEFNSKMIGKFEPEKLIEIAKISIEEVSELIKILHKKFLLQKLRELGIEK